MPEEKHALLPGTCAPRRTDVLMLADAYAHNCPCTDCRRRGRSWGTHTTLETAGSTSSQWCRSCRRQVGRETTGLEFLQGVGQFTPRAAALSRGMVVHMVPPVLHELTLPSAGAT